MKNFLKVFILAAGLVLYFNVSSFAIVDVAGWAGLFQGDANPVSTQGGQLGVKAHYNTPLTPLFNLGVGGYYQRLFLTYEDLGLNCDDIIRSSAGLDVNLILSVTPSINPYFRGTWAFWDKMETDPLDHVPKVTHTNKFKAFGLGIGIEFTVTSFLKIFGEYMFDKTKHYDEKFTSNLFNVGLKLDF